MADLPFGDDVVVSVTEARELCGDPSRSLRHRVALVGASVADAVGSAGGWMFDQAMAGWDTYVVAYDLNGARSLRILGARCIDLREALAEADGGPWPDSLVISADLYRLDGKVREAVGETLKNGRTTVTVWGPDCPLDLAAHARTSLYRISSAAAAFKPRALAAAGIAPIGDASVEPFHTPSLATANLSKRN
ncbi:MAG: hypothetical protein WBB00_03500 [Mycobacterium sp.]